MVLELHDAPKTAEIGSATALIEEPAVPFAVKLDAPPPRPSQSPTAAPVKADL